VLGVECWRCEQPGHIAAECQRPPAATRKELDQRISRYVERWDAGNGISTTQKQQWITAERKAFKGKGPK
jgi:hypothetical protein